MKTTIILSTLLSLTMTSFTTNPTAKHHPEASVYSSEQMARQVVSALQHTSAQEYTALFPSLQEFHQMMEDNSLLYGDFLPDAKQEFASNYERDLIPSVKESFDLIIREGKKKGIDWSTIQFEKIVSTEVEDQRLGTSAIAIVFSSSGKEYTLSLEKVLVMHAQWKVSQFIKLD